MKNKEKSMSLNNYDILFSRLKIESAEIYLVKACNLYNTGGGLIVNYFCYD